MRNIGLVSAAVIAMAAMAGAVAASAPPVIEPHRQNSDDERERVGFQEPILDPNRQAPEQNVPLERFLVYQESAVSTVIFHGVRAAEEAGLSGEAAQQQIKSYVQLYVEEITESGTNIRGLRGIPLAFLSLGHTYQVLINRNQLRRGSDGDLAVSAMLAERDPRSGANRPRNNCRWGGDCPPPPPRVPSTAGGAGRNVPGNAAAGQPATDAGTTGIRRSRATYDSDLDDGYDPDLDDEAGEPD